ncbi:MAG: MerR family DNA-binding transcriptional regulator [Planctomycetota bacterium]
MHRVAPAPTFDPQTEPDSQAPRQAKLTVGRLAAAWGVAPESLRNWERQGLIPQSRRTPGGHRRYRADHVVALTDLLGPPKPGILPESAERPAVRELAAVA